MPTWGEEAMMGAIMGVMGANGSDVLSDRIPLDGEDRPVPKPTKPCRLYRHWSAEYELLYIGITGAGHRRSSAHARGSVWFDEVSRTTWESFPNRREALKAERAAIIKEAPKYNVIYNSGNHQPEVDTRAASPPPPRPVPRTWSPVCEGELIHWWLVDPAGVRDAVWIYTSRSDA